MLAASSSTAGEAHLTVSDQIDEAEWDEYVRSHPEGSLDHLWRWRDVFSRVFDHPSTYLLARRDDVVAGVLPLVQFRSRLFGRFLVSVPFLNYGGVLASDAAAGTALIAEAHEVARRFGASHIELRHTSRQFKDLPSREHKLKLTRPLPTTTDALWSDVDRKVRNQVRKAQKDGLSAQAGHSELIADFYAVFSRNMRDLGTPVYPKSLFVETGRLFADELRVYVVRAARVPVAAAIALRFHDTVIVPWASSLREYRQHCPNMLLYWTMLEDAVQRGVKTFDFGRSTRGAGTHQFKLQWGAEETPMHWEYVLLTRATAPDHGPYNPKFAAAIAAWQRLPLWIANAVGPAIVRNIP
jgi:FemAB-related protein (PEP-CTERM system-associated)